MENKLAEFVDKISEWKNGICLQQTVNISNNIKLSHGNQNPKRKKTHFTSNYCRWHPLHAQWYRYFFLLKWNWFIWEYSIIVSFTNASHRTFTSWTNSIQFTILHVIQRRKSYLIAFKRPDNVCWGHTAILKACNRLYSSHFVIMSAFTLQLKHARSVLFLHWTVYVTVGNANKMLLLRFRSF